MKLVIATVIAFSIAASAYAKPASFKSCSADSKPVILNAELVDEASPETLAHIQKAFDTTAHQLPADQLQDNEGFVLFVNQLSEEDKDAFLKITKPAIQAGSCKVK